MKTPFYARLKHDVQLEMYGYKARPETAFGTIPEPVPLKVAPKKNSGKDDVRLTEEWYNYLKSINTDKGYQFILVQKNGWFNGNTSADTLSFGGNVIIIDEISGDYGRVRTYQVSATPPGALYNFENVPFLVQQVTAVRRDGKVVLPGRGVKSFMYLIRRNDSLWVPLERIEPFPELPQVVVVKAIGGLFIRSYPAKTPGNIIWAYPNNTTVQIFEYAPRGRDVWGRTDKGWIALLYNNNLYTTWSMQTTPPPAF